MSKIVFILNYIYYKYTNSTIQDYLGVLSPLPLSYVVTMEVNVIVPHHMLNIAHICVFEIKL